MSNTNAVKRPSPTTPTWRAAKRGRYVYLHSPPKPYTDEQGVVRYVKAKHKPARRAPPT